MQTGHKWTVQDRTATLSARQGGAGQGTEWFASRVKGDRQDTWHAQGRSVLGMDAKRGSSTTLTFAPVFFFIENIVHLWDAVT